MCLVFFRQEQGGGATVVLSDDPKLLALPMIRGEDACAVLDGQVIGALVFLV